MIRLSRSPNYLAASTIENPYQPPAEIENPIASTCRNDMSATKRQLIARVCLVVMVCSFFAVLILIAAHFGLWTRGLAPQTRRWLMPILGWMTYGLSIVSLVAMI